MTTIAFIDDEINILNAIKRLLRNTGWSVLTFTSSEMAIGELGARDDINIIVSDYHMIGMSGVELLNTFKKYTPNALRILLSGQADLQAVTLAINEAEIYRFITKPWIDEEFLITLTDRKSVV